MLFFFFFSFSPSSFLLALGRVEIWKPANWLQRDEREGGVEGKGEKGERERKFIATRACVFLILKDRNFRRQGEWWVVPNLCTKSLRVFRTWTSDHVLTQKTKAFWKMLNCFTIRRCLLLGEPRVQGPIPLSLREERAVLHQEEEKVSLSSGPHFIQWVYRWARSKKEHPTIRPGSRFDYYRGRAERTVPSGQAGSRLPEGFLPRARARMVSATGQGFTACSRLRGHLLPASPGRLSTPASQEPEGVSASAEHSPAQVPVGKQSRGNGTRLKRLPTFWVNLGQSLSFSSLFGKRKNTKCQVTFTSPALSVPIRSSFQVLSSSLSLRPHPISPFSL